MHDFDRHGVEIPALWWRMFVATVIKNANIRGLANFEPTIKNMEILAEKGVPQTFIQSAHSPVSQAATTLIQSKFYPNQAHVITVESVAGQQRETGHLVDENPAVVSTGRALGIRNNQIL